MELDTLIPGLEKDVQGLDFEALDSFKSKTDLWLEKRRGRFTASEFHRLMRYEDKAELPKGADTYALEKAVESLTTESDFFTSAAMEHGNTTELEAMEFFIEKTGLEVSNYGGDQKFEELGKHVGATPDGRISTIGGVEGKAPNSKTHFFYITNIKNADDLKKHCKNYYWQVQGSMYVCDCDYWYWFSYDPRFKNEHHKMVFIKVERNDEDIEKLKTRIKLATARKLEYLKEIDA